VSGHRRYSEAESRGLARASAPSRRRRGARWRAQRSSAVVYGSGSAVICSKTARERRRRHRRSSPARHRWKPGKTPSRFTAAAKCSTLPRTWPYPTPRPAPPRARRAHGTILGVFRDIPKLERRLGGGVLAPVGVRLLPAPAFSFKRQAIARWCRQQSHPDRCQHTPPQAPLERWIISKHPQCGTMSAARAGGGGSGRGTAPRNRVSRHLPCSPRAS